MIDNKKLEVKLIPLKKVVVNTLTQEDFNTLMRVYEVGKWEWAGRTKPTLELYSFSTHYRDKSCVNAEDNFSIGRIREFKDENYEIISTEEFYKKQNLTPEKIKKINKYFEK